jgi:hypothetical protein
VRRAPLFQGIIDDEDLIRSTASRSLSLSSFLPHPLSLPSSPCRALFDSVFVCRCLKLIACVFVCVGLLTHASAWDRCELARYEEGEVIISQGQSHDDDSMYIIESGSVSVRERAVHCDTGIDMVRTHALASSSRPSLCCCLSLPPSLLLFHPPPLLPLLSLYAHCLTRKISKRIFRKRYTCTLARTKNNRPR